MDNVKNKIFNCAVQKILFEFLHSNMLLPAFSVVLCK